MRNITRNLAKSAVRILAPMGALAAVSPAMAVQSDIMVEQVGTQAPGAGWLIDQVKGPVSASGYLGQIEAPSMNSNVSFQANLVNVTTQLSLAEQVPASARSYGPAVELAFLGYGLAIDDFVRFGQGKSLASDESGNRQQHAWNGAENLQASLQRGSGNHSLQEQTGLRNASLVVQDGRSNFAETAQVTDYALASILQIGSGNRASIYQGTASSFALVSQVGTGNIVSVRQ
jgi:hypothetical protein